jgi:hypothetical protein
MGAVWVNLGEESWNRLRLGVRVRTMGDELNRIPILRRTLFVSLSLR